MTVDQLTQVHRAQQLLLRRATVAQMARLWPALDWARLDETFPDFALSVGRLVTANRQTSAGLASQYLRAFRQASGVPGEVNTVFAEPLNVDQFATSLRVTSVVPLKTAAAAGTLEVDAMKSALVRVSGAMARQVLDAGRDTIVRTVKADPAARGWRRVLGGHGCDFCRLLASRGVAYGKTTVGFQSHDHCVLAGTVVTGPRFEAAYRRWYEGELIVIGFADGGELSITPNHPVLTDLGWVDPQALRPGDQVVRRTGAEPVLGRVPNEQDVPTRIEDAWSTYRVDGFAAVPVAAEDFHGDGVSAQGEVQVVAPHGLLPDVFYSGFGEHLRQPIGAWAGSPPVAAALSAERDLGGVLLAHLDPTGSRVGGIGLGRSVLSGGLCEEHPGGFGRPTTLYSELAEPAFDDRPRDAVLSAEALLGLAFEVAPRDVFGYGLSVPRGLSAPWPRYDPGPTKDQAQRLRVHADLGRRLLERLAGGIEMRSVSDLRRVDFAGHVFNLRTSEGWYDASGAVVSNCGCTTKPVYHR